MPITPNFAARYAVSLTTDANGYATGYINRSDLSASAIPGRLHPLYGEVVKVKYTQDPVAPFDANVNFVLTAETTGEILLGSTDNGRTIWYPRKYLTEASDGKPTMGLSVDADGETTYQNTPIYIHGERIKVQVSNGGANKTGTIAVFMK